MSLTRRFDNVDWCCLSTLFKSIVLYCIVVYFNYWYANYIEFGFECICEKEENAMSRNKNRANKNQKQLTNINMNKNIKYDCNCKTTLIKFEYCCSLCWSRRILSVSCTFSWILHLLLHYFCHEVINQCEAFELVISWPIWSICQFIRTETTECLCSRFDRTNHP